MTIDEASEHYGIPLEILHEYESCGLCDTVKKVMGAWQYDDEDIERLSMIMTLHDIGFENHEVETYMQLLLEGESTNEQRMAMLNRQRKRFLYGNTRSIPARRAMRVFRSANVFRRMTWCPSLIR